MTSRRRKRFLADAGRHIGQRQDRGPRHPRIYQCRADAAERHGAGRADFGDPADDRGAGAGRLSRAAGADLPWRTGAGPRRPEYQRLDFCL